MNKLSQPAQEFMAKILKYYPLDLSNQSQTRQKEHHHPPKSQQHLHDYRKERQIYDKSTKEKIQNIKFFKEQGNQHYKNGRFSQACYFYQKAIVYADYTFPENQQETDLMNDLLQKSNCNLGLCLIKLDQWDKAKLSLVEASKGSDKKIKEKALYWLAKSYLRVCLFKEASQAIDKLSNLSQSSNSCVQQLNGMLKSGIKEDIFKYVFKVMG